MTTAIVNHEGENPASTALYASVGFQKLYAIQQFRKQMC
jgi:hypothetical protein